MEPTWLTHAREFIGQRELNGAPTAPFIAAWLQSLHAWWKDDETPWCGTAIAAWMQDCGIEPAQAWYRAKGWLDWGVALAAPAIGAVVVFERTGGGHVGLVIGKDQSGRLLVLGGNQGDAVSIAAFDPARVIGYRWPSGQLPPVASKLPVIYASGASSVNEA